MLRAEIPLSHIKEEGVEATAPIYASNIALGDLPLVLAYAEEVDFSADQLKPGIHVASATSTYYATDPGRAKDEDKD